MIDQLRHRRATLPERAELAAVDRQLGALELRTKEVRLQRDELGDRQAALEQQIEASRTRREALEKRLFSGQVVASRELQAMNEEVKHLARHISELEDREIEVMEALEPLDRELQAGEATRARSTTTPSGCGRPSPPPRRRSMPSSPRRTRPAPPPPRRVRDDLLARYEQLRSKLGGTGAARLVGGSCSGCHLALVLHGARPRAQGAPRRRDHLRAVRPDPGALTPSCSSSFATARRRGTPPGSSSGDASRR